MDTTGKYLILPFEYFSLRWDRIWGLFFHLSGVVCCPTGGIGPIFTSYRQSPCVKEYPSLHIEGHVCECDRCLGTGNPDCSNHQSHSTFNFGKDMFDMATHLRFPGIGLRRGPLHWPTCRLLAMDAARFADARELYFVLGRTIRGISPDVRCSILRIDQSFA